MGAVAVAGSASVAYAGHRLPGAVPIIQDMGGGLFHCTGALGAARAQPGTTPEAGCDIDPAPSGSAIRCWMTDQTGVTKECVAGGDTMAQTVAAMNSDSMLTFDVLVDQETDSGDCLSLTIENSSAYQPKQM
jgi:hypothetical protein